MIMESWCVDYLVKNLEKLLNSESDVVLKSSRVSLKVRLWLAGAAWTHLIAVTAIILPTDMSGDPDPRIRAFARLKYRFITAWFNFIMLAYFPLCLYCDWREHKGEEQDRHVTLLRKIRDIVFTSILFPTTLFADIFFWRLFLKDPELISPVALFSYMPSWGQHSLHTVSLIMMCLDLVLTPRTKPKSVTARWALLTLFLFVYAFVVFLSYRNGDMVYQMLGTLNNFQIGLLVVMIYLECLAYFLLQWAVIDYLWSGKKKKSAEEVQ